MKIENINEAEQEAKRFLKRLQDLKKHEYNKARFEKSDPSKRTDSCKETGALKRSSMDLTRALSKMRNDTY